MLGEFVELLDRIGVVRQRVLGIGDGALGLVAIAQHDISLHEAQPLVYRPAVAVQAIGQALHHAARHVGALLGIEISARSNIGRAWALICKLICTLTGALTRVLPLPPGRIRRHGDARQSRPHKIGPRRILRRAVE